MLDFSRFSLSNMVESGTVLRSLGDRAGSMEEVAGRIVTAISDWFRVPETGQPACVLVRLFKTHRYRHLPAELQAIARGQTRNGDRSLDPRRDLRAFFHDQADRPGDGPWTVDRLRDRAIARRPDRVRLLARRGNAVHCTPSPGVPPPPARAATRYPEAPTCGHVPRQASHDPAVPRRPRIILRILAHSHLYIGLSNASNAVQCDQSGGFASPIVATPLRIPRIGRFDEGSGTS